MAHKVHPKSYRIRGINDWGSRWYHKEPARYVEEDFIIKKFLEDKIGKTGIEKIEIERFPNKINIIISSARPGLIIGRGGEGIEKLRKEIEQKVLRKPLFSSFYKKFTSGGKELNADKKKEIRIEIREVKNPWVSAKLSGEWAAGRIEKRIPYRRVMKEVLSKIMSNKEVKGAKIELSGRLNGNEIARKEWLSEGRLPRQTLRADIDFSLSQAYCTYGVIGIKIWIYKGEKFD
ncbi:MAG: 30S ribosomal protein S3 [Candidatus Pacebacteria bacterium]|nr:30S ribosomal protein S3 [Candidatus Paceibacterota bacterium]